MESKEQPDATSSGLSPAGMRLVDVIFELPDGDLRIRTEVAETPDQQQVGMMYREQMPLDSGMLFTMKTERVQVFWMKNTYVSLDMIFVSAAHVVVGVVEEAEPRTRTQRSVPVPSSYILEVPGGYARTKGIAAGVKMRVEPITP